MLKRLLTVMLGAMLCITSVECVAATKVVFMGDSITELWGRYAPGFFTSNDYVCSGISGQTTKTMLGRFTTDVINRNPQVVVILAGTNDIARNDGYFVSMEQIFSNIVRMAEMAKAKNIKVILCSVVPSSGYAWTASIKPANLVARLNTLLEEYAATHDCGWVDYYSMFATADGSIDSKFSSDGCHPLPAGYVLMEQALMPVLEPMIK